MNVCAVIDCGDEIPEQDFVCPWHYQRIPLHFKILLRQQTNQEQTPYFIWRMKAIRDLNMQEKNERKAE